MFIDKYLLPKLFDWICQVGEWNIILIDRTIFRDSIVLIILFPAQ